MHHQIHLDISFLVFSSTILAATVDFPVPAATASWPASCVFSVYHHPSAATLSSCNNPMKPKSDRLITFLGVLFDFFPITAVARIVARVHRRFFGVFIHTTPTPPKRHSHCPSNNIYELSSADQLKKELAC